MDQVNTSLRRALHGVSGILVTPFDGDDRIAPERLRPIIDRAVGAGVGTLVSNGNTGEFYCLSTQEAEAMVGATAEIVAGRVPLIAGVGRAIGDAIALTRASRKAGATALMVHQPPDPFVSPRGVVSYIARIADEGQGLPVLLYLRDDGIGVETIAKLCAIPNVVGVKWACPTPLRLREAIQASDPSLVWVGGLAEIWAPAFYAVGARGFTSGLINVWPEHSVAINVALEKGNFSCANKLISQMSEFEALRAQERNGANVSVIKAALMLLDQNCGAPRVPAAWPLADSAKSKLSELLSQWSVLQTSERAARIA